MWQLATCPDQSGVGLCLAALCATYTGFQMLADNTMAPEYGSWARPTAPILQLVTSSNDCVRAKHHLPVLFKTMHTTIAVGTSSASLMRQTVHGPLSTSASKISVLTKTSSAAYKVISNTQVAHTTLLDRSKVSSHLELADTLGSGQAYACCCTLAVL